jgi:hypothetical protein
MNVHSATPSVTVANQVDQLLGPRRRQFKMRRLCGRSAQYRMGLEKAGEPKQGRQSYNEADSDPEECRPERLAVPSFLMALRHTPGWSDQHGSIDNKVRGLGGHWCPRRRGACGRCILEGGRQTPLTSGQVRYDDAREACRIGIGRSGVTPERSDGLSDGASQQ